MYQFDRNFMEKIIEYKGPNSRIMKAQEECSEFIAEAFHLMDGRKDAKSNLLGEIGDVYLCLEFLRVMFGDKEIDNYCKLAEEKLRKHFKI